MRGERERKEKGENLNEGKKGKGGSTYKEEMV